MRKSVIRLSNDHCNRSHPRSVQNKTKIHYKIKFKMEAAKYTLYPVGKTDNKAFLSKVCLGEGKTFYYISLRMNWHSQPNSIMEIQKIILSSKNILSQNL